MIGVKLNIASVLKNDGASKDFSGEINLGKVDYMGSTLDFESPLAVVGKVLNIGGTIEISAQITGQFVTECSRCGVKVTEDFSADLFESMENDFSDVDAECISVQGNVIDISGSIDACIFGNIPMQTLCREDCKGLCPECGINLNEKECNCDTTVYDPRFAIFRNLSKEV